MNDFSDLVRALASLLWPLILIYFLYTFRGELRDLVTRIRRGKVGNVELEIDPELNHLEEAANKADDAVRAAPTHVSPTDGSSVIDERDVLKEVREVLADAARSPKSALMLLATAIDREMREILTAKVDPKRLEEPGRTYRETLDRLDLPPEIKEAVRQFNEVKDRIVHGPLVTDNEALRAIDSGITILNALKSYPRRHWRICEPHVILFEDPNGDRVRDVFHGVTLETRGSDGSKLGSVVATTAYHFKAGKHVAWEWDVEHRCGQSWYRDPKTNELKYAFAESPNFIGRHLEDL